jgi:hypothetical protein
VGWPRFKCDKTGFAITYTSIRKSYRHFFHPLI